MDGLAGGVLDVEGAFGGRGVLVKAVFRWRGLIDGWKGCFGGGNVVDRKRLYGAYLLLCFHIGPRAQVGRCDCGVGRGVWPCWARWLGWAWCWACWAR